MRLRYITTDVTEVTKKYHICLFLALTSPCSSVLYPQVFVHINLLYFLHRTQKFTRLFQVTDLRWREPVKDSDDEEEERYSDDEIDINDNAES